MHSKQPLDCILLFATNFFAYYAKLYNRAERFESKKVESR
jgi:hypothetical protein